MNDLTIARHIKYEFEVPIERSPAHTWTTMIDDINAWWIDDFRALGEGSTVSLNAQAGGQLIENAKDGSSLEWYRVQMVAPGKSLYLIGYLAPDWGRPTTSMLKLAVEDRGGGCALIVSDALLGNVSEASALRAENGWKTLFQKGLKEFAEN